MAVTNKEIVDFLILNPGISDADIFAAMRKNGISPNQLSTATGLPLKDVIARLSPILPQNEAVLLGDTWVQAQYRTTGSGETQEIGPLEQIYLSKTTGGINDKQPVGTPVDQYSPTGDFLGTIKTQKEKSFLGGLADAFKDPVVLAALGGAAAGGLLGGTGALTGATTAQLAATDIALGGAGGTLGAETLASALTTGATVPTLTNLTGGSGLLTGAAGGITAESVAAKLAADAAAQAAITQAELLNAGAGAFTPTYVPPVVTPPVVTPPVVTAPPVAVTPPAAVTPVPPVAVAPPVVAATAVPPAVIPPLVSAVAAPVIKSLVTPTNVGNLVNTAATTAAGLLQQQTSREAALAAQQRIDAETAAAKTAAQFRPVGMTTRFGTSQFQVDPVTGQLTSAGYTLSPEAKAQQDRFVALSNQGLTQAEQAQAQFAPLQTSAQKMLGLGQGYLNAQNDPRLAQIASQYLAQSPESKMLTSLGSQYIAQSPEQVAQNYLNQQMALLQPGRELELANLQNKLQQQGRGGLSVSQGGAYGATTPELQALYNARAMQEAQLAAGAQQAGQQQVQFGAGLFGTGQKLGMEGQAFGIDTLAKQQALEQQRLALGTSLYSQGAQNLGQYYAGQQAAYAPYTTAMSQAQALESAGQQPLTLGASLGQTSAAAGGKMGTLGLEGARLSSNLATGQAATTNPYATALGGLAASPVFGQVVSNVASGLFSTPTSGFSYGQYGTGVDPSTGEYFGSLYF
jgi:hypothetical protein